MSKRPKKKRKRVAICGHVSRRLGILRDQGADDGCDGQGQQRDERQLIETNSFQSASGCRRMPFAVMRERGPFR
jgi:hypothetical protein